MVQNSFRQGKLKRRLPESQGRNFIFGQALQLPLPTTYQPHIDHIPTTYQPHTVLIIIILTIADHILTTY